MNRLGRTVVRHRWRFIAAAVAVTIVCLLPASRFQLRADLASLLPDDSNAARGYREYTERFGGTKTTFVILDVPSAASDVEPFNLTEAARLFAQILAESDDVLGARAGLTDDDLADFLDGVVRRAPLLVPDQEWIDHVESRLTPTAIRRRVQDIRRTLLSPVQTAETQFFTHDPLGFSSEIIDLDRPGISQIVDPVTLGFLSHDQRAALILVEPSATELEAAAGQRLADAINNSAETLRDTIGVDIRVRAVGGPLYAAHDEVFIRADLVRTMAATAICCGLIIFAVFSGLAIPAATLAALVAGLVWTAAVLAVTNGGCSAVAVGFSAVLIGLGIDATIHGGTSFRLHLLGGHNRTSAMVNAFDDTLRPILTASATTAAAFAVLLASSLPLLRELGLGVAIGIGLIVVSTATLGAPLAVVLTRKTSSPSRLWGWIGTMVDRIVEFSARHSFGVLAGAVVITVVTLPAALTTTVQGGLDGLRPTDHPVLEAETALIDLFGIHEETMTIIVHGSDLDEAVESTSAIQRELQRRFPNLGFTSPAERVDPPARTRRRLDKLSSLGIGSAIDTLRLELKEAGLDEIAFRPGIDALEAFANGKDPGGRSPEQDHQLRFEDNGEVWAELTVIPPRDGWPDKTMFEIREAVEMVDGGALIASLPLVGSDLRELASSDLRRLSALSLVLVFAVVALSFRGKIGLTFQALLPVLFGTVWALGCWNMAGRHIDIVGLAVLPVLLGLGIDDGLYAIHGARGGDNRGIKASLARSGRAMTLTTITTCIGFGSLGFSHLPSLRAIAVLIPFGVGACLLGTLMVLPALAERGWGIR